MILCTNWRFSDQPEVANVVDRKVEYSPLRGSLLEYTDNQPYAPQNHLQRELQIHFGGIKGGPRSMNAGSYNVQTRCIYHLSSGNPLL